MAENTPVSQRDNPKRRRYSRVKIDCSAWLIADGVRLRFDKVCNLSMGGACMLGQSPLKKGDLCELELHEFQGDTCMTYTYQARVAWTGNDRLAIEFTDMDSDSYMFLQTMILYHAEDPLDVVKEFQDGFPCCR